jgi:hypothetical protein
MHAGALPIRGRGGIIRRPQFPETDTDMYRSSATIGATAARRLYDATGSEVVWAILATGIDATHPHFALHKNLELPPPLAHLDFTHDGDPRAGSPLVDDMGFGTHVAGVVAGEVPPENGPCVALTRRRDETGTTVYERTSVRAVAAIAPQCKLVSMKTLDAHGRGAASNLIRALRTIQEINEYGQRLLIQGVLVPVGFDYDSETFACGMSPFCIEVDRLVRSGVVVVAPSGNTGYGSLAALAGTTRNAMEATIEDPGNAELAITVGATHRDLPFEYGVSYFSSKGPTADGRMKPDIVAPGERIASCASATKLDELGETAGGSAVYVEDSGTGVASAHVAGVIAALQSARRDLIGRPGDVKELLLRTATDLRRQASYQGYGLVNLMLALQGAPSSRPNMADRRPRDSVPPMPAAVAPPVPVAADAATTRNMRLMCSYSHKDAVLLDELQTHLAPLKREGLISTWFDGEIPAGSDWSNEIKLEMERADIILLLVSAPFIASEYCYGVEMREALARHEKGTARVIPIVVRPVDWGKAPFAKLKALPRDGRAVTQWENQDEAWVDVVKGIRRAIDDDAGRDDSR